MTQTTFAVAAHELRKTYRARKRGQSDVTALDGLGFSVPSGQVFALLGPNGAGKSTTVRILTTLTRPDAGRAWVAGRDVVRDPAAVRAQIGVVTQASGSLVHLTGRENLMLQGRIFGLGGRALDHRVEALLDHFDLGGAADRVVRGYSGGMQRRLDIAIGLVHRPRILFLDEPTTGLDPEARRLTWAALGDIAGQQELTVVLTTHYLEEADTFAAAVAIVDRGQVVIEGNPDQLKRALRGDTVHIELPSPDVAAQASPVVDAALGTSAMPDGLSLVAQVADGARALPVVLGALDSAGVPGGVGARGPAVAGSGVSALCGAFVRRRRQQGGGGGVTFARQTYAIAARHIKTLLRQGAFVFITLAQPVIWLLLFGALFKRVTEIPGFGSHDYIAFLTPGVVIMTALFSAGWSGMTFIEDMDSGVMDRFLASPVHRGALMTASLASQAVMTVIQSLIIILLGWATGATFPGGAAGLVTLVGVSVLIAIAVAAMSNGLALVARQRETLIAASSGLVLPLTFLSSAFLATTLVTPWIRDIARFNPVDWAIKAGRYAIGADAHWATIGSYVGFLVGTCVVAGWLATRAFGAYQRAS